MRLHRDRPAVVLGIQVAVSAAFLGCWELLVAVGWLSDLYVSRPTAIAAAVDEGLETGELTRGLAVTLIETLGGFAIAVVAGSAAAFLLYQLPTLARVSQPFVTAANNLPRLALMPLFVLWLGFGSASRIAVVVSLAFFVVLLNSLAGLRSADPDHLRLARVLGASRLRLVTVFVVPGALPSFFAGLQLALTYSFLGAVVGEMLSGSDGLGAQIQLALATYRTADFFAALLLVAVAATALSAVLRAVEHRLLAWRRLALT